MITGKIDIHAHLIPGVDDGSPSLEDSLACARMFVEAGYTHLTCTPHVWPQLPHNTVESIRRETASLQRACDEAGIPVRLLPGGELNLEWYWPAIRERKPDQIPSFGLAGKHLIFDFWADLFPEFLTEAVAHLQKLGFTLIMAHPERVRAFQRDVRMIERLEKMGLLLQCNSWCLMDRPGLPTRDISERLLKEGRYFCLGTDTHNAASLPVRLQGIEQAVEMVGEQAVRKLTVENPAKLFPPDMLNAR